MSGVYIKQEISEGGDSDGDSTHASGDNVDGDTGPAQVPVTPTQRVMPSFGYMSGKYC